MSGAHGIYVWVVPWWVAMLVNLGKLINESFIISKCEAANKILKELNIQINYFLDFYSFNLIFRLVVHD